MLRVGRFRHRLLDDEFLKNQSPQAYESLQPFLSLWQQGRLNDIEIATIYILIFSFYRRPKDFLGGPHNAFSTSQNRTDFLRSCDFLDIFRATLPSMMREAKPLQKFQTEQPLAEFACSLSWRSIPLSVTKSLVSWLHGHYPLVLLTTLPSPEEVLQMQTQGRRCVSMLIEKEQITNFVEEGRDVLGFIVHDLIHADHFFAAPEKARAQVEFCKRLQFVLTMPVIQKMLQEDDEFKKEFHYLMSDMNSVPIHLLKTLKAILLGAVKRRHNIALTQPLNPAAEYEFSHLFSDILVPWNFDEEALGAAFRLNTICLSTQQDIELLHLALTTNACDKDKVLC